MFCFLNLDLGSSPCFGWSLFSSCIHYHSLSFGKIVYVVHSWERVQVFYLFLENVLHYESFYTLIVQLRTLLGHMESKKGEVKEQGLDPGGQQIWLHGRRYTARRKNRLWRENQEVGSHPGKGDVEGQAGDARLTVKRRQGKRQRRRNCCPLSLHGPGRGDACTASNGYVSLRGPPRHRQG